MTAPVTETAGTGFEERLQNLVDRAEISALIDRYTILLDTQDESGVDPDWPQRIFTEDCRLTYPIGGHSGWAGLAEFHREAKEKFAATHHLSGNHAIVLDGDRADVRFHMMATHVHRPETRRGAPTDPGPLFGIGGHYVGEAVRTDDGWRFSTWSFHVAWTAGVGPADLS